MAKNGRIWGWKLASASFLAMGGAIASSFECAIAQITPDGTLGAESSVVTPQAPGATIDVISGGATRGANLFHSFEQFSVPTGGEAFFNNALDIQNIISRVTGSSISNIDGLLRANGTANLFLLNPNGINFGSNARLSIGGSFVGSTASSLNFADGTQFSATAPTTTPLLSVSVPIGLQFGETAGSIVNQSQATNSSSELVGLQVQPGKTLALVGGNVRLDSGSLNAPGGRVELGSVSGQETLGLNFTDNNLRLSFPDYGARADISLINGSRVNVSETNGGSIAINARSLDISGGSRLRAGIAPGLGTASSQAGDITLNATEAIEVRQTSGIANNVFSNATGNSGDLVITTGSIFVTDGSQLSTSTFGQGNAGNVIINARDRVWFDGRSRDGRSGSYAISRVEQTGRGKGGDILIATGVLEVTNGAQLLAATRGQGNAGNVIINARDRVSLDGTSSDSRFGSAAFSSVDVTGIGKGGDIRITTEELELTNGAQLVATTDGQGNAGNVIINARAHVWFDGRSRDGRSGSNVFSDVGLTGRGEGGDIRISTGSLSVTNGAQMVAITRGQGNAGNVIIEARDTISLVGTGRNSRFFTGAGSTVEIGAVGNGGSISIITPSELSLSNGALLSASSGGEGKAGDVQLQAGSIRVEQGRIGAATLSGDGGNITLSVQDLLLLLSGSSISTTAGTALAGGDGGNITINAPKGFIVAVPSENSDITANAFSGKGGNVTIAATSIFGMNVRSRENLIRLLGTNEPTQLTPLLLPTSDITAVSQLSPTLSGLVTINTPDVDPNRGLVNLPTQPTETKVVQACTPGTSKQQSEFVVTGRGGLPPTPNEALSSDAIQVDWVTLNPEISNRSSATPSSNFRQESATTQIVEATGWMVNDLGEVVLTAAAPTANLDIPWLPNSGCRAPQPAS